MSAVVTELAGEYEEILRGYLRDGDEEAHLHRAYELGRRALGRGFGIFDILACHHQALAVLLRDRGIPEDGQHVLDAGRLFLVEALSPFEMAQGQVREAVAAWGRLNDRLEDEIKRIAHALHDEAGQLLASVYLALDELDRESPGTLRQVGRIRELLGRIEGELRRLSHELRPTILDDLGLMPALGALADGLSKRTGIRVDVDGDPEERFHPQIEIAIYRVAQEALANIARHAHATQAVIAVASGADMLSCTIHDDGQGFEPDALRASNRWGLGLIGMRERIGALGGRLRITSAPGRGTLVAATIPLGAPARSAWASAPPPGGSHVHSRPAR
jgi:signal transduction histidine kinase